jgi:6-phosphogluconolactonase (cycloisomerase 2 family)
MYNINVSTGKLTSLTPSTIAVVGVPDNMAIHPGGTFLYSANNTGTITAYHINLSTGMLTPASPATCDMTGLGPTSIAIYPNGRYAYTTNMNDGSISMFSIDSETGQLVPLNSAKVSEGDGPHRLVIR